MFYAKKVTKLPDLTVLSFIGGVHIGARALHVIIWYGLAVSLASGKERGNILVKWFLPAFATRRGGGGGSAPYDADPAYSEKLFWVPYLLTPCSEEAGAGEGPWAVVQPQISIHVCWGCGEADAPDPALLHLHLPVGLVLNTGHHQIEDSVVIFSSFFIRIRTQLDADVSPSPYSCFRRNLE